MKTHARLVLAAVGAAVALTAMSGAALAGTAGFGPFPTNPEPTACGPGHDGPLTEPVHDTHDALNPVLGPIFGDPDQPGETVHTTVEPLTCT